jgi:hypothetical protein
VAANGECGPGLEFPTLRCIKHEKMSNQGHEVDLANCDQYEIFTANTSYTRACEVKCVFYKWQEIDSAVSNENMFFHSRTFFEIAKLSTVVFGDLR